MASHESVLVVEYVRGELDRKRRKEQQTGNKESTNEKPECGIILNLNSELPINHKEPKWLPRRRAKRAAYINTPSIS